jgi:hypothetical protein
MDAQLQLMEDLSMVGDYLTIPDRPTFMKGYINLISECAKEIDPQYEPPFMMGMDIEEVKDLQMATLRSYTVYDAARYRLFTSRGIDKSYDDIEKARFSKGLQTVRNYSDAYTIGRSGIEDVHIQKEIMKEEFGKKSIFWRIRHPFKAYEMWNFIKTAEKALLRLLQKKTHVRHPKSVLRRALSPFPTETESRCVFTNGRGIPSAAWRSILGPTTTPFFRAFRKTPLPFLKCLPKRRPSCPFSPLCRSIISSPPYSFAFICTGASAFTRAFTCRQI